MTVVSEFTSTKEYFQSLDDATKEKLKEFFRLKQRVLRHGSNVVLKRGRPKVSESHKKRRRAEYLEKQRQKKKEDGTYRPRGRPRKKSE
jgi:hypothetical protein